jgi:hypothetical protein
MPVFFFQKRISREGIFMLAAGSAAQIGGLLTAVSAALPRC